MIATINLSRYLPNGAVVRKVEFMCMYKDEKPTSNTSQATINICYGALTKNISTLSAYGSGYINFTSTMAGNSYYDPFFGIVQYGSTETSTRTTNSRTITYAEKSTAIKVELDLKNLVNNIGTSNSKPINSVDKNGQSYISDAYITISASVDIALDTPTTHSKTIHISPLYIYWTY
jgi:hypothetical protein